MNTLPGIRFLQAYPREQLWRLFVDGCFWSKENGWEGYESREPGSLGAALESLCSNALSINNADEFKLSVALIRDIHKRCGKKVKVLEDKSPGETRTNEPMSFGIPASRATVKGISEFLNLSFIREGNAKFGPGEMGVFSPNLHHNFLKEESYDTLGEEIYSEMLNSGYNNPVYFYDAVRENVDVYLDDIVQSFNNEIHHSESIDEKLKTIGNYSPL